MDALCLVVAGALRAVLPGSEFTLAWQHSVEKTRWEERYRIAPGVLELIEARVRGHGAGMEPPPDARAVDGAWVWAPGTRLRTLDLARSPAVADYTLCAAGGCRTLGDWIALPADDGSVQLRPCADAPPR